MIDRSHLYDRLMDYEGPSAGLDIHTNLDMKVVYEKFRKEKGNRTPRRNNEAYQRADRNDETQGGRSVSATLRSVAGCDTQT